MTRPAMTVGHFQKLLRKAGATPYQGRKSFANWMEDAEVMRTVRRMLLGHGAKDVTDRYEKREISQLLADVRVRMLKVLGSESMLQLSKTAGLVVAPIAQEA
jgi:integrase